MFDFKDVCKTYQSKRGRDCDALKDISLTLPSKGLVVLCGRSGSGKSTFLNILGGLDKPTSGEVSFNGNKLSEFGEDDLANYRNDAVGFVFQEFNLIDNLNVSQNIMIPLSLQNKKSRTDLMQEALKKVGLEGYEKRRINELSGGQKQRVAIARVLVKQPQVILADEPTGNLDSKTSQEIFELLKVLSKECLVLVVTHDEEKAKQYHDYLIELADGEVLFNNCPESKPKYEPLPKPKSSLPFWVSVKMGADNFAKKPIRTISAILVAVLTIFCVTMLQFFLLYSRDEAQCRIIQNDEDMKLFSLTQSQRTSLIEARGLAFSYGFLKELDSRYPDLEYLTKNERGETIIEGADDVINFGFEFVGDYLELDRDSKYVSENTLHNMYLSDNYFVENAAGADIKLLKSEYPPESIAGTRIKDITTVGNEKRIREFVIAGVVRTDNLTNGQVFAEFYAKNYIHSSPFKSIYMQGASILGGGKVTDLPYISLYERFYYEQASCIVLSDGALTSHAEVRIDAGQIILNLEAYNSLFGSSFTGYDYVNVSGEEVKEYSLRQLPPHLNTEISLRLSDNRGYEVHNKQYTVVGVALDFSDNSPYALLPREDFQGLYNDVSVTTLIVNKNSVNNLRSFLSDMQGQGVFADVHLDLLKGIEKEFYRAQYLFGVFSVILVIIMLLLVINLISVSILSRTKEIGILKAIGAKNKDLFLIYFAESFIISAIVFLLSLGIAFAGAAYLNHDFASGTNVELTLFVVKFWTGLIIFAASFVTIFIATLIPLLRIKRMNPIDAIKTIG